MKFPSAPCRLTAPIRAAPRPYEKRDISDLVAAWDPGLCIQCGNCSFVCPHSVIRAKYYDESRLDGAPRGFPSAPLDACGLPDAPSGSSLTRGRIVDPYTYPPGGYQFGVVSPGKAGLLCLISGMDSPLTYDRHSLRTVGP